jgi:hypothetical protein
MDIKNNSNDQCADDDSFDCMVNKVRSSNQKSTAEEPKKDITQTDKDYAALKQAGSDVAGAVGAPSASSIPPRVYGYGLGAFAGPPAANFLQRFSRDSLEKAALNKQLEQLSVAQQRAQLAQKQASIGQNVTPEESVVYRKPSGHENYISAMQGESEVPYALSSQATSMRGDEPTGATAIMRDNAAREAKAKNIASGYQLTGEDVVPKAPGKAQLYLPEGMKLPSQEAADALQPSVGALEKAGQKLSQVGGDVGSYAKLLANSPLAKGILHGANLLGTGLQSISDIYNKDPTGLAIDAFQVGLPMATGPAGVLTGTTVSEAARYLKDNPDVRKKLSDEMTTTINAFGSGDFTP